MLNDYFNPNASKPQNGWQPQGFLGGMGYAQGQMQYEDQMKMQRELTLQHIMQQQMANDVYRQKDLISAGAQGRQATSTADLGDQVNRASMADPRYAPAMVGGKIGEAQQQESKGRFDMATTDSKIADTKGESMLKQWTTTAQRIEHEMSMNPAYGQSGYSQFLKTLPPELQGKFPEQYSKAHMDEFIKSAENSIAQRQKIGVEHSKDEGNIEIAHIQGMYSLMKERERVANKTKDYQTTLRDARTPEHQLSIAQQIDQDPDASPRLKQQARVVANSAAQQIAAKWGVKLPSPLPGLPDHPIQDVVKHLAGLAVGAQPAEGGGHTMAEIRKLYPGKTDAWIKDAYKRKFGVEPK